MICRLCSNDRVLAAKAVIRAREFSAKVTSIREKSGDRHFRFAHIVDKRGDLVTPFRHPAIDTKDYGYGQKAAVHGTSYGGFSLLSEQRKYPPIVGLLKPGAKDPATVETMEATIHGSARRSLIIPAYDVNSLLINSEQADYTFSKGGKEDLHNVEMAALEFKHVLWGSSPNVETTPEKNIEIDALIQLLKFEPMNDLLIGDEKDLLEKVLSICGKDTSY